MVALQDYLAAVEAIAGEKPVYRTGGDGSDGTCDCVGLTIGALKRCGGVWTGVHGSNWGARHAVEGLAPLGGAGELAAGAVVLKGRRPGAAGYDLPARYQGADDATDYYHWGVVTGVSPLRIVHCTTPGIQVDTSAKAWTHRAWLTQVAPAGTPEPGNGWARVTASSGETVKMRSAPSAAEPLYWNVPVGASVEVLAAGAAWSRIRYGGREGYMQSAFLQAGEGPQDREEGTVAVPRGELQALYEALGRWLDGAR